MQRRLFALFGFAVMSSTAMTAKTTQGREVIDLNGTWTICEAKGDSVPATAAFTRAVPVPGLVDLAKPAFPAVGTRDSSEQRDVFWYRRTFKLDREVPEVAFLKFHKVRYGCRVCLNGVEIGKGARNFSPHYFDVKSALQGGGAENELLICVGADRRPSVAAGVPDGYDKEKSRYVPGIFDNVELILTGMPYIETVQVAPCPPSSSILVQTSLSGRRLVVLQGDVEMKVRLIVLAIASVSLLLSSAEVSGRRPPLPTPLPETSDEFLGKPQAPAKPLVLWYDRPGSKYHTDLPFGNGRIGGMVDGGVSIERIWLNEDSHRHFFLTQASHLFCARVRQEYDASGGEGADRLTVEQVRSAMNTWLAAADLKPAQRKERYQAELKNQRYHQRRNQQARNSHTKTRLARLNALGIDANKIKSCAAWGLRSRPTPFAAPDLKQ